LLGGTADCHQSFPERLRSLTSSGNSAGSNRINDDLLDFGHVRKNLDAVAFSLVAPVVSIPVSIRSISFRQCFGVGKVDQTSRFDITLESNVELISS
jgi:hypothetical protein